MEAANPVSGQLKRSNWEALKELPMRSLHAQAELGQASPTCR